MSNDGTDDRVFQDALDGNLKAEIQRIGVRVPPFYPQDPELWLSQLEQQFILARVTTDETKFSHLATSLSFEYAREVRDIMTNPPLTGKYEKLKSELIKRLSASQEKRVKQLLMHEELGDRRPSQFLRHLESLAGPSIPKDFLVTLWSSRLPQNVQTVIATQTDLSLEKLSDIADKVYDLAPPMPQVAAAAASLYPSPSNVSHPHHNQPSYAELVQEVCELRKQLAAFKMQADQPGRSHSKKGKYNRSRSHSRSRQPPLNYPHCYYHYTYGDKAKKCKEPCSFKESLTESLTKECTNTTVPIV